MSEIDEYTIQKQIARSLESVNVRIWGHWGGADTKPRWRCNKHPQHEFMDTVDNVTKREAEIGTGCPRCALLMERPVVPFEVFSVDAERVNKALKGSRDKSLRKARNASFNRLQAS